MIDPLYSLSGFAVGALVGMTGVGGGSLDDPALDSAIWNSSRDRGGHRSAVCGGHQDRRQPGPRFRAQHRLARGQAPRDGQRSGDDRHACGAIAFQSQRRCRSQSDYTRSQCRAVCNRFCSGIWQRHRRGLSRARRRARSAADSRQYGPGWRSARRARVDFFRRCRRHRRDRADHALSAASDGEELSAPTSHMRCRSRSLPASGTG